MLGSYHVKGDTGHTKPMLFVFWSALGALREVTQESSYLIILPGQGQVLCHWDRLTPCNWPLQAGPDWLVRGDLNGGILGIWHIRNAKKSLCCDRKGNRLQKSGFPRILMSQGLCGDTVRFHWCEVLLPRVVDSRSNPGLRVASSPHVHEQALWEAQVVTGSTGH